MPALVYGVGGGLWAWLTLLTMLLCTYPYVSDICRAGIDLVRLTCGFPCIPWSGASRPARMPVPVTCGFLCVPWSGASEIARVLVPVTCGYPHSRRLYVSMVVPGLR